MIKAKAVIFDLDGVILDSMFIWRDLGVRYLNERGIEPEEGLSDTLFSMSMEQGAVYLKEHYPIGTSAEDVEKAIEDMLQSFYFNEVALKCGAGELLKELKQAGIPVMAATSSPREHVTRALRRNGVLDCFLGILTTGEVGVSKHEPLIYHMAAEAMGAAPEETVVFEDSLYALRTAKEAGFYTVGVYDADGESDQAGMEETAHCYVKDLREVRRGE